MYRNPNYQKEYHRYYIKTEKGRLITEKCNKKYLSSKKFKETRKKYNDNNKQKISESNRKYYFKNKYKTKEKKTKVKKEKNHTLPRVEIIYKPIILSFF